MAPSLTSAFGFQKNVYANKQMTTYLASAIRHLSSAESGSMVAAAEYKEQVSIWDLANGEKLAEFDTTLDFGGRRLAVSSAESACLCAAYERHGLSCYEVPSGRLRWQRRDIKKVQQIVVSPDGRTAHCSVQEGPCQLVSIATGATIGSMRGIKSIWMAQQDGLEVREASRGGCGVFREGKSLFKIPIESFAVLAVAFGEASVAVSEAGGPTRVFDLNSGSEVASFATPDIHSLELCAASAFKSFCAVTWNYRTGGPKSLVQFDPTDSSCRLLKSLGEVATEAFCCEGKLLLTSEGEVLSTESGELVRKLVFPSKEYPCR